MNHPIPWKVDGRVITDANNEIVMELNDRTEGFRICAEVNK
jgi:hypothetical protein